jgi:hypothetical protein
LIDIGTKRDVVRKLGMMRPLIRAALVCGFVFPVLVNALEARQDSRRLVGTVRDSLTGNTVPYAVVGIVGGESAVADQQGRFSLDAISAPVKLQVRVIGFRAATLDVGGNDDRTGLEVFLHRIPVALSDIMITGDWVNPAHRIIRGAIARKQELRDRINDYRYEAYTKLLIRDAARHRDSTDSVVLITETQSSAYWQKPDQYQETILGRRQSSNITAENNLVSVGEIVNFSKDRIDLEKYSVVSPTADDALDHYDYFILDTLDIDGWTAIRLAIEPRSQARPLFAGMIDITDSSFDVLAIDVRGNSAIRYDFVESIRYQQRMSEIQSSYWMPTLITFSGSIKLGVPLPGLPREMNFSHEATLTEFRFDEGDAPSTLGEYLVVVDDGADDLDSLEWREIRPYTLPGVEGAAYDRIDSLEQRPRSVGGMIGLGLFGALFLSSQSDFFHFNRAEGAYLGAGTTLRNLSPDWIVRAKSGYAIGLDEWQHRYGFNYRVSETQRWWVGATYRDEVRGRPSLVSGGVNATQLALLAKRDPLDYYHEQGWSVSTSAKVTNFTTVGVSYNDFSQASVGVNSGYSFFDKDRPLRSNPPIVDGKLRSFSGTFSFDSRPRLKTKGRDFVFNFIVQTQVRFGIEYANSALISSDFDFTRVYASLHRVQRTFNLGLTTIDAFAGTSSGQLPPQRYFTVDFGNGLLFQRAGFNTMDDQNFSGNRAAMFAINHDFDQQLFRRSRIPLIEKIPFTVSVHGGAFWTELSERLETALPPIRLPVRTARGGYAELGFGLANLTPMIAPFNFATWFTWQLTDHATSRFKLRFGIPTPN